ncbi:MAG: hypothetical protein KGS72_25015 [Cyanobacteria bacterium REEB67]|nr:hypothetical protein [Cyanobacteria bacterium REEB67]
MNTLFASAYNSATGFSLPARGAFGGISLDALSAIGITAQGDTDDYNLRRCMLPADWKAVPAKESEYQLRFEDGLGRLRAKVFLKPGSQGGGADMEVCPRFSVRLVTDETLQWAEVYDGATLIHRTATGFKADGNLDAFGFNASKQLEHIQATAWLAARQPDHADPLAYWN